MHPGFKALNHIEKYRIQKHFDAKAECYESSAVLQREVCDRMLERLHLVTLKPECVVDVGAGTGWGVQGLLKHYPSSRIIALDISSAMLKQSKQKGGWFRKPGLVCGDAESIPMADASVDIVFSSLMLQWCDAEKVFEEFHRILKPGGMLMFSTFGPDTLKELRYSWKQVDDKIHVNDFVDMHDLGDALLAKGFAEPVMDMDLMTLTYNDAKEVMMDLKNIGANTPMKNENRGLLTPRKFQRVLDAYESFRKEGVVPASYEIVYGHAWKSEKVASKKIEPKEISVSLEKFKSGM
jgi:malonyl-CoA O-methyltransferase